MNQEILAKAAAIRLVICDVDGALTNGYLYLAEQGFQIRAFHVHDGFGLKLLKSVGIEVGIITTSKTPIIEERMAMLGIEHLYMGQENKVSAFEDLLTKLNLQPEQVAYIGDYLPDLVLIKRAGLGAGVANAAPLVREHADLVTLNNGGQGAVRELCDIILHAQNKLEQAMKPYE